MERKLLWRIPLRSSAHHKTGETGTSEQLLKPPFELQHIDHVVIRCNAFEPMFHFYHRVLGCTIDEPASDYVNRFGGALTHLRAGSCYIDLVAYDLSHLTDDGIDAVSKIHGGGQGTSSIHDVTFCSDTSTLDHLCIRVEPFNELQMLGYLEMQNVPIVVSGGDRLGADGIARSIYVRDPEGNVVELKGPPQTTNQPQSNDDGIEFKMKEQRHSQTHQQHSIDSSQEENEKKASGNTSTTTDATSKVPATPCIRICRYNSNFYDGQVCIGCYREAYEIKGWQSMTSTEKAMALLDSIDRCDGSEGAFEGATSKHELIRQYEHWAETAKTTIE